MARILFTTFGSHGDLHPYLAVGRELKRRGHEVTIATSASHRASVEAECITFHPVRPDIALDDRALLEQIFDRRRGTERVVRMIGSRIRETYEDTRPVVEGADLVVTHLSSVAAVAIVEKLGKPWVSTVLAPAAFLSAYDPPVPAVASWIVKARVFGPAFMRRIWAVARQVSLGWVRDVIEFRREIGLSTAEHPLFEGAYSPKLVLAMFSRHFAAPAPDWPPKVNVTGFPFYCGRSPAPQDLLRFMEFGPAPIVFTLGSSAVGAAGSFYKDSVEVVGRLGARAVFLTGSFPQDLSSNLPADVFVAQYAPHSEMFPRAAAIVHQGGIGTTAQALRSGRPMLVVPFAHDQYDNAARVRRLGAGEMLPRPRYTVAAATKRLRKLLENPAYTQTAAALGDQVRAEDGVAACADAIESCVHIAPRHHS